jgi:glucoamylase
VAWDEKAGMVAVLLTDPALTAASVGYLRKSDGLSDLQDGSMDWTFDTLPKPGYGAATLALPAGEPVTLVVGFGPSEQQARAAAQASLARGLDAVARDYIAGWHTYLGRLTPPPLDDPLYWVSAMVLKAHEDKTAHGAGVASLSAPWGECLPDKDASNQGYRYVWPRDLYHVATAFVALGDEDTAQDILAYLDDVMQEPNGSFPQNTFLDGRTRWGSLQMDEVADPILLAGMLGASDRYETLVKPAADYIAAHGPTTMQERWEEVGGYVPHSIAAQVAALVVAAGMAEQAGDRASATAWLARADDWEKQIQAWTFTTAGSLGNGRYYLRFTPKGDPDQAQIVSVANGGGMHPLQDILDVSALELVRLGVRGPADATILDTLPELDQALMEQTPNGPGWHRYSFDAYGEPRPLECSPGKGWLWPIFNGERGHFALAAGDLANARAMLQAMQRMGNQGGMLPEQVLTSTGEGSGSATPLAWAHAEYILLVRSIEDGKIFDRPPAVFERYGKVGARP